MITSATLGLNNVKLMSELIKKELKNVNRQALVKML